MNKFCSTVIFLACASTLAPVAHAVTVAEARQGVQAAIDKRIAARRQRDVAAYLSTFAPTWTLTNVSGATQTYAQMQKIMTARLSHLPLSQMYKMSWQMTSLTVSGNQAHATLAVQYAYPPRQTPKGTVYVYQNEVSDSIWEKSPTGWTQRSDQLLYDSKVFSKRALAAGERRTPGY
ncbi:hypothetical protein CCAX7_63600 [Capsulimonas corticalis]|uniref:Uncharacterized protein n=1 Tax=Capsulimonas corticalis TaxID=2219043 RepID=A0A402CWY4_9BACT|nr:hypothetical protein [Capsulimonas corticalis]BDI34309.1 hypothetical protein CCAX7_63600 [Capsulimonas corticalis]